MRKNLIKTLLLVFMPIIIIITQNIVYATLGGQLDTGIYNQVTSEQATELDNTLYKIAGTVITILQVAAMAGVVVTGVKYMYAGSEDKGKIKQTLIWVVVGAIFVFAAPKIINLITGAGNGVF